MPSNGANSKSPIKPVRQVKKKVMLEKDDISGLINEGLFNGPPSTIKVPSTRGKRKPPPPPEPDSDLEIIESTPQADQKRRKVDCIPASPSAAPTQLSSPIELPDKSAKSAAGSLVAALDAASLANALLNDGLPDQDSISPSGRPIRLRVKSEKARQSESPSKAPARNRPPPVDLPKNPNAPVREKSKKKSLQQVKAEASAALKARKAADGPPNMDAEATRLPPVDVPDGAVSDDSLPEVSQLLTTASSPSVRRVRRPCVLVSDEEEEDGVSVPLTQAPRTPQSKSSRLNPFIDDEAVESDTEIHASGEEEGVSAAGGGDSDGGKSQDGNSGDDLDAVSDNGCNVDDGSNVVEAEDDPDKVMQPSLWHHNMAATYRDLPFLSDVREIQPFSNGNFDIAGSTLRVSVGDMASAMKRENVRCLVAGLTFVQSGQFVNTARINPQLLDVDPTSGRLRVASSGAQAIGVMLGLVTECALIEATTAGNQRAPYRSHRITIAPAPQEFRRDVSVWGERHLLNFGSTIRGPSSELGFSFSTLPERRGPALGSVPASPVTTPRKSVSSSKYAKPVKMPFVSNKPSSAQFGQTPAFEQLVPIYDGREGFGEAFNFTDADFNRLPKWPTFKDNKRDIPIDSVVAVGYTVGTYVSNNTSQTYLSSNIQFVMVLSVPTITIG